MKGNAVNLESPSGNLPRPHHPVAVGIQNHQIAEYEPEAF